MQNLIDLLKAFGDMTRLRLLKLICEQEFNVCELARLLDISQPAVSQHLRRLKAVGLAEEERRGQWIYYRGLKESARQFNIEFRDFFNRPLEEIEDFKEITVVLQSRDDIEADCQKQESGL